MSAEQLKGAHLCLSDAESVEIAQVVGGEDRRMGHGVCEGANECQVRLNVIALAGRVALRVESGQREETGLAEGL